MPIHPLQWLKSYWLLLTADRPRCQSFHLSSFHKLLSGCNSPSCIPQMFALKFQPVVLSLSLTNERVPWIRSQLLSRSLSVCFVKLSISLCRLSFQAYVSPSLFIFLYKFPGQFNFPLCTYLERRTQKERGG